MFEKLNATAANVAAWFDARDIMLVIGLGLLAIGLWQVYPPAALIAPGIILTGVAIFGVKHSPEQD